MSGASIPTAADAVIFDGNSGGGICTVQSGQTALSLTCTGYTGTIVLNNSNSKITLSGSLVVGSSMGSPAFDVAMIFIATASITTNGKTLSSGSGQSIEVNGSGITVTLQDDLVCLGEFILTKGTFNANNKNVTIAKVSSASNTRVLQMGTGTWTITAGNFDLNSATGLTVTPSTSTIKFTGTGTRTFAGYGKTYYNLWDAKTSGTLTISGANTFHDIKIDAGLTVSLTASVTQTATSLTWAGSAGSTITIQSTSAGTPFTISIASGAISVSYCSIKDSTATGGATFTASNSTNVSGNTGWNFGGGGGAFFLLYSLAAFAALGLAGLPAMVPAGALAMRPPFPRRLAARYARRRDSPPRLQRRLAA